MARHNEPPWPDQINDWTTDLISDAEHAERQAEEGPHYPERGITPETLRAYAQTCRAQAADPDTSLRAALGPDPGPGRTRAP